LNKSLYKSDFSPEYTTLLWMALAADARLVAQSKDFDPTINEKNTQLLLLMTMMKT
jgi:hypothetical protein